MRVNMDCKFMPTKLFNDPLWPRAGAWLAGEHAENTLGSLAVLGVPVRLGSITPGRCDLTPQAVREILRKFSCHDLETEADLHSIAARDLGDLPVAEKMLADAFEPIREGVAKALTNHDVVALIGGDNGITRPGVHALGLALDRCGLITLDAHFDLRDLSLGLTNGNPVRALLNDGLPGENIVQIGIQPFANSKAYAEVAREAGITVITISHIRREDIETIVGDALLQLSERAEAIYVDFDIDVLDRAFAPATPGSRPGGLTPWELSRAAWLCGAFPKVRAIDLVEVDPSNDVADATVLATGSCLLSFASGLVRRWQR